MKKLRQLLLLTALMALAAPAMARADSVVCIDRSKMVDTLVDTYGEQLAEVHEIKGQGLLEFHVSPRDGSWTALITDDEGVSCVLATGEGLDPVKSLHMEPGDEI